MGNKQKKVFYGTIPRNRVSRNSLEQFVNAKHPHGHRVQQQDDFHSKRLSDDSGQYTQTGRNTFDKPVTADAFDLQADIDLQHQPLSQLSTRSSQQHSERYKTILVHKSVLSSFCQPDLETKLSAHVLVRQALKGIANKCAHKNKTKPSIWNPQVVIQWFLRSEPNLSSVFEVSRRCATLLLLASGRRVHDLTLLSIKEGECVIDEGIITFWPLYGSKTDSINHRQSGWQFLSGDDQNIDPVFWIKKLLEVSQPR
ncbi:putative reverse transcriptase-7, partial [Operophtera brumata]